MESEPKLIEVLQFQPRVGEGSDTQKEKSEEGEEYDPAGEREEDRDEDDEEEFTFMFGGGNSSPIAAEDAFVNGKIKPIFPLFGRALLSGEDEVGLPERPLVKKVFVEMRGSGDDDADEGGRIGGSTVMLTSTSASASAVEEEEEISGPYCEWSKGAAAPAPPSPEGCKKSNSTGFSKLWRFKDLLHRSNSDGRDAFVFLNSPPLGTSSSSSSSAAEKKRNGGEEVKAKVNDRKGKEGKKGGKTKTASLSPHEIYLRRKSEDDRRRSFRPEVFGFFTTVNGGMSRNVHPF